jgi:ABC-type branched-subunit amino acid transport system ATPase component
MLSEARRAVSYVHCDVKNSSAQNADQLGLRRWRALEMETAHCARPARTRLVLLDEGAGDTKVVQPLLMKGFAEPTAIVKMPFGNNH